MSNYRNILERNWLRYDPVQQWYQSKGSKSWEKPTPNHMQRNYEKSFLSREKTADPLPMYNQKKRISAECKEMLKNRVKEIEAFNASKLRGTKKEDGSAITRKYRYHDDDFWNQRQKEVTQNLDRLNLCDPNGYKARLMCMKNPRKMKRSRCYICFTRGHAYWNCPSKQRRTEFKKRKQLEETKKEVTTGLEKTTGNNYDVSVKTFINWEVLGTTHEGRIWYVSDEYPRHMTPNLDLFEKFKAEIVGTSATIEAGLKVQGIGEVLIRTKGRNLVIPGVFYVPNTSLNTLSLSQLMQQGFEVVFKDTKCIVKGLFDDMDNKLAIGTPSYDPVCERMVHCWTCNDYHLDYMCPLREDSTDNQNGFKESIGECNSDKENVDCMEGEQGLNAVKGKAIEAVMKYFDSLYFSENTIGESMSGIQGPRAPSKNEFDSLIGFIKMVSEQEIIEGCKELVRNHFEKMVHWFHKDYMEDEEQPIPAMINGAEVNLLDLFLTVKGLGGHTQVVIENKWKEVAYAMGFPKEYANELQKCYGMYLSLLGAYYEVAISYSSGMYVPKATECEGTSGIRAMELPREETRQGHIGTRIRLIDDEERMSCKDRESAIKGKIKIEDDDYEVKFKNF